MDTIDGTQNLPTTYPFMATSAGIDHNGKVSCTSIQLVGFNGTDFLVPSNGHSSFSTRAREKIFLCAPVGNQRRIFEILLERVKKEHTEKITQIEKANEHLSR